MSEAVQPRVVAMNNASLDRKSPALPFAFHARAFGVVLLLGSLVNSFAASSFVGLGTNSYA